MIQLDAIAGRSRLQITSVAVVTLVLALLALAAPVSRAEFPAARVGWLLTLAAGDTHDLEYYAEPASMPSDTVHYFVNGGGGAFLGLGTALAWPAQAPTADWAYYPTRDAVARKIDARTPWWKRPAWWWTQHFDAWPFGAGWLSAAFDYNVAPFFQSFVEVKVERSANRVRVIPYGVHGRLTWGDLSSSPGLRTANGNDRALVEWVIPMRSVPIPR